MENCASVIGSIVTVTVDRPMGSVHPKHRKNLRGEYDYYI